MSPAYEYQLIIIDCSSKAVRVVDLLFSIVPVANKSQHLSVMFQELFQCIQLLIWSQRLHGGSQLKNGGGRGGGGEKWRERERDRGEERKNGGRGGERKKAH